MGTPEVIRLTVSLSNYFATPGRLSLWIKVILKESFIKILPLNFGHHLKASCSILETLLSTRSRLIQTSQAQSAVNTGMYFLARDDLKS